MPPNRGRRARRNRTAADSGAARRGAWNAERPGHRPGRRVESFTNAAMARAAVEDLQPKAPPGAPGSVNWTPMGPAVALRGAGAGPARR